MEPIEFVIPGEWTVENKRSHNRGKFTVRVDAKPQAEFKAKCALAAREAMGERPPLDEPLVGMIVWYCRKPSGYRKHENVPWKRPDLDNMCKIVLDAITEIVMTDDSKFVVLTLEKRFGDREEAQVYVAPYDAEWPYRKEPSDARPEDHRDAQ